MNSHTGSGTIGGFLQRLRKARKLTITRAAAVSGIHRTTLDRWEKGDYQPRISELNSLLEALGASEQQRLNALRLVEAPRAGKLVRQHIAQIAEQSGVSPIPNGGDLLYAMRMRRGVSLDEAAACLGLTGGTLRRWERMEIWPSTEQLTALCGYYRADNCEIDSLTSGRFSKVHHQSTVSLNSLCERFDLVHSTIQCAVIDGRHVVGIPLLDLTFHQLEADAWPLALRSAAGKQMLIKLYANHCQILSVQDRLVEAGIIAMKALELMENDLVPQEYWLYPVIVSARSLALSGNRPSPLRGIERLRQWSSLTHAGEWQEMEGWLQADMAKYISASGNGSAAIDFAERACRIAESTGNIADMCLRKWDKATVLLETGRPNEALKLLQETSGIMTDPGERVAYLLLLADAQLRLGERSEAQRCALLAEIEIEAKDMELMRRRFQRLAAIL